MNKFQVKYALNLLLILSTCQIMAENSRSKNIKNAISLNVSSGDIQGLVSMVPELELLWKEDTQAYLQSIYSVAPVLRDSTDPEAVEAAWKIFENVLDKTGPLESEAATNYFTLKYKIISGYFALKGMPSNKKRLLMVANFLGEIRSRRITDYKIRGVSSPGLNVLITAGTMDAKKLTASQNLMFERAIDQNDQDRKMDQLQKALFSADRGLYFKMAHYVEGLPVTRVENRDFYEEFARRAKLTVKERAKLQLPDR